MAMENALLEEDRQTIVSSIHRAASNPGTRTPGWPGKVKIRARTLSAGPRLRSCSKTRDTSGMWHVAQIKSKFHDPAMRP
jgi:hypothetical protein